MIRSMTAFGRQEQQLDWGSLSWEVRCVNHRYLEISTRMPEDLRQLETQVRESVGKFLKRGKVECSCRLKLNADSQQHSIDRQFAQSLLRVCAELEALAPAQFSPINPLDVLKWPGVMQVAETDWASVRSAALDMLKQLLTELVETREREGAQLSDFITQRTAEIGSIVAKVRKIYPAIVQRQQERLMQKVADLAAELDPARLEQEVALLAQKMDVAEELDRLELHYKEVDRLLGSKEPVGRRLDFLMQELNREANTLGSKSVDPDTTRASVDLKVLIEQIREQVQNIE